MDSSPDYVDRERESQDAPRCNTIVNVKYFDDETTAEALTEMLAKFGVIKSCKIMNEHLDVYRRFAYVAFEDPDAAENAIIELNNKKTSRDDRRLRLERTHAKHRAHRPRAILVEERKINNSEDGRTVYVRNFDHTMNTEKLRSIFGRYGTITLAKIINGDATGSGRRYGFVTFANSEEARDAAKRMQSARRFASDLRVEMARGKNPDRPHSAIRHGIGAAHAAGNSSSDSYSGLRRGYPRMSLSVQESILRSGIRRTTPIIGSDRQTSVSASNSVVGLERTGPSTSDRQSSVLASILNREGSLSLSDLTKMRNDEMNGEC